MARRINWPLIGAYAFLLVFWTVIVLLITGCAINYQRCTDGVQSEVDIGGFIKVRTCEEKPDSEESGQGG